jgi:16S rRNA G966 N2-methylase RsmD
MPPRPPTPWHNAIVRYADEPPESLFANPQNWRIHPRPQTAALTGSLTELGWIAPVIVNLTTQHVVDGHARIGEAIARGEASVPVAYVNLTLEQERLALATFDPITSLAGTDQAMLDELLAGLSTDQAGLAELLESLATEQPKQLNPDDADLTPPADPITQPGDLWLLGEHRLLCGDSTSTDDMARLMAGEQADVCLTDPPYNVGITYTELTDDAQLPQRYIDWSRAWLAVAQSASRCVVVSVGMMSFTTWVRDVAEPYWVCAWRKANQRSPSRLRGFNAWEPLLVYGKPAKQVGVDAWDVPVAIDQPLELQGLHPAVKTLKPWATFLEAFTDPADAVLDVFCGSGTTLVACEQLGRRCYAMEIEPAYVDVAVRRWEHLTGRQAVRDG